MKRPNCACVDSDPRTCFERRYLGHFDDPDDIDQDERCECACHIHDADGRNDWDDEDEGWDRED